MKTNEYFRHHFGTFIRILRKSAGLSLETAGVSIGMHASSLSRLENAKYLPSFERCLWIIAVYSDFLDKEQFFSLAFDAMRLMFYPYLDESLDILTALADFERSACSRRRPSPVAKGAGHCMSGASARFKPCADAAGCEEHAK